MAEPASKKKKSVLELFKTITYGRYDGLSGTLELPAPPQRKKMAEPASKKKKSVLELFKTITYGRYDGLSGTLELPAPPKERK